MNKQQKMFKYIKDTTGITVSKMLLSFILHPNRLAALNNVDLKDIVVEYAPVFNKYRWMLDGPSEQNQISFFTISLMCRVTNKPELKSILGIDDEK